MSLLSFRKLISTEALSSFFMLAFSQSLMAATVYYVNGDSSTKVSLNDGAFFTGYALGDSTIPSAFSGNFLVQGNEQATSAALALDAIPISVTGGSAGFQFFFDAQETQNNSGSPNKERNIIAEITFFYITAAQQADAVDDLSQMLGIWSMTAGDQVNINDIGSINDSSIPNYIPTNKPLGNGADASLNIPFSVFPSGATSADYVFLRATLSDGDNGNDEWIYSSDPGIVTFANSPDLNPDLATAAAELVPEPSTSILLVLASSAAFIRRRIK